MPKTKQPPAAKAGATKKPAEPCYVLRRTSPTEVHFLDEHGVAMIDVADAERFTSEDAALTWLDEMVPADERAAWEAFDLRTWPHDGFVLRERDGDYLDSAQDSLVSLPSLAFTFQTIAEAREWIAAEGAEGEAWRIIDCATKAQVPDDEIADAALEAEVAQDDPDAPVDDARAYEPAAETVVQGEPVAPRPKGKAKPLTIHVRARDFALAWHNAALMSGDDKQRPALYRTVALEVFHGRGVQLVGCNGSTLLRAWVPVIDDQGSYTLDSARTMPSRHIRPDLTVIVQDPAKFARAFCATVEASVRGEEDAFAPMTLKLTPKDSPAEPALGAPLLRWALSLQALDQALTCTLFDGEFPNWRALDFGYLSLAYVQEMAVAGKALARLGKLKGVGALQLTFRGEEKAIEFAAEGDIIIAGLQMPMRKQEINRPADEEPEDDDDQVEADFGAVAAVERDE